jgi:hypothetical protein
MPGPGILAETPIGFKVTTRHAGAQIIWRKTSPLLEASVRASLSVCVCRRNAMH